MSTRSLSNLLSAVSAPKSSLRYVLPSQTLSELLSSSQRLERLLGNPLALSLEAIGDRMTAIHANESLSTEAKNLQLSQLVWLRSKVMDYLGESNSSSDESFLVAPIPRPLGVGGGRESLGAQLQSPLNPLPQPSPLAQPPPLPPPPQPRVAPAVPPPTQAQAIPQGQPLSVPNSSPPPPPPPPLPTPRAPLPASQKPALTDPTNILAVIPKEQRARANELIASIQRAENANVSLHQDGSIAIRGRMITGSNLGE